MSDVPLARLADLASPKGLIGGPFGSSLGKKDYVPAGVPVIRGQNLGGARRFTATNFVFVTKEKVATELARNTAEPGDIVFTQRGTLGQVGLIPDEPYEKYVISQSQMRLRVDPERADALYIYYCFRDPAMVQLIHRRAIVTGVPHINLSILAGLEVPCPSLSEQRAIARVLGTLDDKIDANTQTVDVSTSLLQCTFEEIFGAGTIAIADQLPLPAGWRQAELGDCLGVLETGKRPKGGVAAYAEGVPSVGAESIVRIGIYDYSKTKYVPVEFFESMNRGIVTDKDVLLYKDGGRPGEFEPHVSMFGSGFPFLQFCINEHVYRLRVSPPLTQEFLYCWLESEPMLERMRRMGTGVAIPGLNSTAVRLLPIAIPPARLLDEFEDTAVALTTTILGAASESRALSMLRDALLPRLLAGDLQVRVAEELIEATP